MRRTLTAVPHRPRPRPPPLVLLAACGGSGRRAVGVRRPAAPRPVRRGPRRRRGLRSSARRPAARSDGLAPAFTGGDRTPPSSAPALQEAADQIRASSRRPRSPPTGPPSPTASTRSPRPRRPRSAATGVGSAQQQVGASCGEADRAGDERADLPGGKCGLSRRRRTLPRRPADAAGRPRSARHSSPKWRTQLTEGRRPQRGSAAADVDAAGVAATAPGRPGRCTSRRWGAPRSAGAARSTAPGCRPRRSARRPRPARRRATKYSVDVAVHGDRAVVAADVDGLAEAGGRTGARTTPAVAA